MLGYAWAQIRANPARLGAVLAAVVIGTAFLAATAVFTATSAAGLRAVAAAPLSAADVVVDPAPKGGDLGPSWPDQIADHPDVAAVTPTHARTVQLRTEDQRAATNVYSVADQPSLRWFDVDEGEWPTQPDEVVADAATLESAGLAVGDTVHLVDSGGAESSVTVVGASDLGFQPLTGVQYELYAPESFFGGDTPASALVTVVDGASPGDTVRSLAADLPDTLVPGTAEEQAEAAADRFAGGAQQLEVILLVFALIALLAAGMVITNTFTILLAQRRRDTALLRLVGADRGQVRTAVITEALLVGSAGSLLGVGVGVGAGFLGSAAMGLSGGGLDVSVLALAGCFLVGVVTTVLAAWIPARRAARTAPEEALRSAPLAGAVRFGAIHLVGALAALLGTAAMGAGVVGDVLPLAIGGGFVGATGLLLFLRYVLSRLVSAADPVLRRMGGVAGLAGANLRRNPGRAATATLTLVLGLGLITALLTAATTGQATIDGDLRDRYPVDVSARVESGAVDPATVDRVAEIIALETVEPVRTADVEAGELGRVTLVGASPSMADAAGATELARDNGNAPVMLVSADQLDALGADSGEEVRLDVNGAEQTFTVITSALATASGSAAPVVRADVLDSLDAGATSGMVWGVAAPGADRDALAERMNEVAASDPAVTLSGALSERQDITEVLDVMVNLALAMLLITVVIAVIGVTNTLGLSVLERTRESALLRALGLTRAGIRGTLAVEAMVIVVLGGLLGIVVGVPYGVAGVDAIVGATAPLVVSVPWGALGAVLLAGLATGVVAMLYPARRANRIAPAEGLGDE